MLSIRAAVLGAIFLVNIATYGMCANSKTHYQVVSNSSTSVDTFVGRKDILEKIKRNLEKQKFASVSGYGGIGKTQVVRKYIDEVQKSQDKYNIVWWIDCENNIDVQVNDLLEEACDEFTDKVCRIKSNIRSVFRNIRGIARQKNLKILIVLDNIPSLQAIKELNDEVKRENDMDVIYVSRAIIDDNRDIKIPIFNSKESKKYITNIMGHIKPEEISELESIYQGYPILMEQGLSDILYNQDMSINDHIEYQKKHFKNIVADRKTNYDSIQKDYRYNFTEVLKANVGYLKLHSKNSARLLELLVYLAHKFDDNVIRTIVEDNITQEKYDIGIIKKELTKRFLIKMNKKKFK